MDTSNHIDGEAFEAAHDLAAMTAEIVAAYVSHNAVRTPDLPELILSVHASIVGLNKAPTSNESEVSKATAAEIRKSLKPDALVSFVDGRPYKTLKRHLTTHGLTPDAYRARYGLPHDYPMVAANYAAARSELAKKLGLGQMRRKGPGAATKSAAAEAITSQPAPKPKRRGRPKKGMFV